MDGGGQDAGASSVGIARVLAERYPVVADGIRAASGWQFVVRCILARGTTVNRAEQMEAVLAERLLGIADYAARDPFDLALLLGRLPFGREKARSLVEAARHLLAYHDGRVPAATDDLARVPGLGRIGANRVQSEYHGRPAIVADRAVCRVLHRLGWISAPRRSEAERVVAHRLPSREWVAFGHRLRRLAGEHCRRGGTRCAACPLRGRCPSGT